MSGRILVTGLGGPAGAGVAAWLRSRGAEVLGADADRRALNGVPFESIELPLAREPEFVGELVRAARHHGVTCIVPTVSEELPVLARARAAMGREGLEVLVADPVPVYLANDKLLTASALVTAGVPVPRFCALDARPDPGALELLGLPCLTKPRISRGGREIKVHRSAESFLATSLVQPSIAQEFLPGAEYAVQLFVSPKDTAAAVLAKTSLTDGEVGNAAGVEHSDEPDVAAVAISAARALGLTGGLDLDVRRDSAGRPAVLEVNARFGAWASSAPEILEHALGSLLPTEALV